MPSSYIEKLYIYPVKSLGAVEVETLHFSAAGVVNDRRYMLVDHQGRFITQRTHSFLSQFQLSAVSNGWQVTAADGSTVVIDDSDSGDRLVPTKVWGDELVGREKSTFVSAWFSQHLDELVYLIELDDLANRYCESAGHKVPFAFADGYPLLVANSASLVALNEQMGTALEMLRFRPNVVISVPEQQEYELASLQFDDGGELLLTEPCVRCNMPAIDPKTSVYQRHIHKELKRWLNREGSTVFGMNAIAINTAVIRTGQKVQYAGINNEKTL